MRSPIVGAGCTKNNCRGGFYQQYLTSTNNLNKPAPTPPITYINLDFLNMRSRIVGVGFTKNNCRGGFYQQYLTSTNNLNKPAPTPPITYINLDFLGFSKHKRSIYPVREGGFTRLWVIDDDCW